MVRTVDKPSGARPGSPARGRGRVIARRTLRWLLVAATAPVLGGCGIGPPLLRRDALDYQVALSESWKRQMLLNIIKVRYADAPVFLEVTSIINQHSVEGKLKGLGVLNGPDWTHRQELGVDITAYNRPTVTYAPLTGAKFARQLMSPIQPTTILSMVQSGWPVDFVLRLTCESLNGVRNSSSSALNQRQADAAFGELIAAMRRVQVSDTIGVRIERQGKGEVATLFFGREPTETVAGDTARIRQLLGIDPGAERIRLAYGAVQTDRDELSILSRSMLQVLVELGGCIDVPSVHLEKGQAAPASACVGANPLMKVHSGRKAPSDAAAAVAYKGHWFWVADSDFPSKRMLSLLMMFFSLTETGGGSGAPSITVSAG